MNGACAFRPRMSGGEVHCSVYPAGHPCRAVIDIGVGEVEHREHAQHEMGLPLGITLALGASGVYCVAGHFDDEPIWKNNMSTRLTVLPSERNDFCVVGLGMPASPSNRNIRRSRWPFRLSPPTPPAGFAPS